MNADTAATARPRILVVEDDPSIALGLKLNLGAEGYEVSVADEGALGLSRISGEPWDVVILDVMLPKLNGFEIVTRMRTAGNETPVLMLSAKSAEADKVMGLELGAEDYITKPFGIGELLARIKVALRRRPKRELEVGASSAKKGSSRSRMSSWIRTAVRSAGPVRQWR